MSAEDKDIEALMRFIGKVAEQYALVGSDEDRSLQYFDEVTALFDEYLARRSQDESQTAELLPWQHGWLDRVLNRVAMLAYAVKYGTPPLREHLVEAFQAGLEKQKKIKIGERRTLNIYHVISFTNDGSCTASLAPKQAYSKAIVCFFAVGILTLAALYLAWTTLSQFLVGIPVCYTLGIVLGWFWRDSYEGAWGRDKLARRLSQQFRFLRLQGT